MPLPQPSPSTAALVTGASSGIGVDLARELARRGHNVVLVARREQELTAVAEELRRDHGVRAEVLTCDLTDPEGLAALPARVGALGLDVDVLINNAGYGSSGGFETLDPVSEARMVRLNCEAVVALSAAYAPSFVERGAGGILVVASTAAFQPLPRQATYGATKAFALSFSEALHTELSSKGVSVTALCPGPVETEFAQRAGLQEVFDNVPSVAKVSSADVARQAISGLDRGKRVVVPGLANRLSGLGSRWTPHSVLLPMLKRFYPA